MDKIKENNIKYSPEERLELLKIAMGKNGYEMAIKDLAPLEGGLSEYYEIYKIPYYKK
jgi:hypothetical protein